MAAMTDSPDSNRPHPMLQAALGTLDMTVESEMALFRQYQTLVTLPETEISEAEVGEPQFLPQAPVKTTASPPTSEMMASDPPLNLENAEAESSFPPAQLDSSDEIAEDLTPSELALFQVDTASAATEEDVVNVVEQQEAVLESTESTPFDQGNTVAGAPLPPDAEEDDPQVSNLDPAIQDYLDSSTALRQHLEDSSAEPDVSPADPSKFTSKRLALLLGLSVLGTLVIVLFLNVTGLRKKLWPPKRPQPTQTQSSASAADQGLSASPPTSSPSNTPAVIVATKGPDLSKKEFSDVTLGNLSRLQPSPSLKPSPPSPSAPTRSDPSAQSAAVQDSVPVLKDQKSQTGLFYVVLPYNNATSLNQAQKRVPTAFLTRGTGGQQVQVGALETMEAAQRLAKQLRTQGLSAAIIAPH